MEATKAVEDSSLRRAHDRGLPWTVVEQGQLAKGVASAILCDMAFSPASARMLACLKAATSDEIHGVAQIALLEDSLAIGGWHGSQGQHDLGQERLVQTIKKGV